MYKYKIVYINAEGRERWTIVEADSVEDAICSIEFGSCGDDITEIVEIIEV